MVGSLIAAIALLITKTLMTAALAVLYLGAPLAIVVAPIDELAWLSRAALQSIVAILLVAGAHRAVLCDLRAAEQTRWSPAGGTA